MMNTNETAAVAVDCPVLRAWLKLPHLCARGALGKVAQVSQDELDRQTVADNSEMLEPLIVNFGNLISNWLTITKDKIHKKYHEFVWLMIY